jgi:hypothetical protein
LATATDRKGHDDREVDEYKRQYLSQHGASLLFERLTDANDLVRQRLKNPHRTLRTLKPLAGLI